MERPARKGVFAFIEGAAVPWQGYQYLRSHEALWKYAWWPLVINAFIAVVLSIGASYTLSYFNHWVLGWFSPGWWGTVLRWLLMVGMGLVLFGMGIMLAVVLGTLLCSFFYTRLTRQVELQLGAVPEELKDLSMLTEIRDGVMALLELCMWNLGLVTLNLLPGIGSAISVVGAWLVNSYLVAIEFLYPLMIRGWDRKRRREFAHRHHMYMLGIGSVVLVLNMVPIVGSFVLTTAVVGSVLLFRKIEY